LTDELLKNSVLQRFLPYAAGLFFVVLFVSLGRWQLDRAAEKEDLLALFEDDAPYAHPADFDALEEFDRIEIFGRYDGAHQVLIDNIPMEGRLGYYVITPFRPNTTDSLLLVNRGWVPKNGPSGDAPEIPVDGDFHTVQGLVGHLPRVAIRPGEAFAGRDGWPRVALYPTLDEMAAELGEPVLPAVLLLSPTAEYGFLRHWQPNIRGPLTNYSYALQWFAMAAATVAIVAWHTRKRWLRGTGKA
jgi:surfeit locus 1 family protein